MILKIFTDGGSKGNPGLAAIGGVGYLDKKVLFEFREDIGVATNNDAEYKAVIKALNQVNELKSSRVNEFKEINKIVFNSDSQLLVNQLNGLYRVKNGRIREYIMQIRILEQEIKISVSYQHVPREKNQVADDLVNNINTRN